MMDPMPHHEGFTVSLNTTEDCNLACKYCYEINKHRKTLDLETAKKFIDIILQDPDPCNIKGREKYSPIGIHLYDNVIFDFIGGDALMKPALVDSIIQHIVKRLYTWNTENCKKWRNRWRVSISTNGTLFAKPEVRKFCEDWKDVLSLGVSIDGCPELHDMNRVYLNGKGSLTDILKYWDWYRTNFPIDSQITKSTLAKNSIPWIYKSLKFMYEELGIRWVNQNFIMEPTGCTEEDYKLLEEQLEQCSEYVLTHCDDLYWSMIDKQRFAEHEATYKLDEFTSKGWCGGGSMPALGIDGDIYPCFRFLPHTQDAKSRLLSIGNVEDGALLHKESFMKCQEGAIRANCTKDEKCRHCVYEPSCAYCIGGCYCEYGDFIRTTNICEITKIQCEAAKRYWNKYNKLKGKNEKEYKLYERM